MVESAAALFSEANWGLTHFAGADLGGRRACNGLVGDCIDPYAETMMDSEVSRRTLAQGGKFISYGALKKNNVPCNRRGRSYYNCRREEGLTLTSVVAAPSHIVLDTPTDKGKKTQERETDSGLIQSIMLLS
ncbi:Protein RALF-like 33 [Vitis vinifera]|uniref:Protein RALF-like 33 n=1 Tax=Vitis vinifera TaxID=29760 RepID=A0A438BSZ2_VITVI|nr:Protein RALF-like 33 [Vitis vinifera]